MGEIFISYASADRERIQPLVKALERGGWAVWWDRRIPPGRSFDEVIEERLNAASCVVAVWTKSSVASSWVKNEAEEGRQRGVLVPVSLDEIKIPLAFRHIETARLTDWQGEPDHPELELLLQSVAAVAGEPPKLKPVKPASEAYLAASEPPHLGATLKTFGGTFLSDPTDVALRGDAPSTEGGTPAEPKPAPATYVPLNIPSGVGHLSTWQYVGMLAALIAVGTLLTKFCGGEARRMSGAVSPAPTLENPSPVGLEFVTLPAGEFLMGSESGEADERPVHRVRISRSFEMGKNEVTQAQWQALMGSNPSHFKGDNRPVENVSWDDVQQFIAKLNRKNDGHLYRLPTEAEWEYACRAGSGGEYAGNLDEMGWYDENSNGQTHPVGQKRANAWGLSDMHGNVWEWCQDWSGQYASSVVTDPAGPGVGSYRVIRGGSWYNVAASCTSAQRSSNDPNQRNFRLGFRLVRTSK